MFSITFKEQLGLKANAGSFGNIKKLRHAKRGVSHFMTKYTRLWT